MMTVKYEFYSNENCSGIVVAIKSSCHKQEGWHLFKTLASASFV
jgi:hypothetical protein